MVSVVLDVEVVTVVRVVRVFVVVLVVVEGKHSVHWLQVAQVQIVVQGRGRPWQLLKHVTGSSRCVVVVNTRGRVPAVVTTTASVVVGAAVVVTAGPGVVVEGSGGFCVVKGGKVAGGGGSEGMTMLLHSMHVAHVGQVHLMNHWCPLE
mmetsp:Transcript_12920/g.29332  ORF Transcript_12920/g.29332 Transcript_12920/m.29332 type:complete len:149 (-) Transcript_12920:321-767(-)